MAVSSRGLLVTSAVLLREASEISKGDPELAAQNEHIADALRRRAISTAYYAVFHQVCAALAERITFGLPDRDRLALHARAYRTLDHGQLKKAAQRLARVTDGTDRDLEIVRNLCVFLVDLFAARQSADYDPDYCASQEEASRLVQIAEDQWPFFAFSDSDDTPVYEKRLVAELLARDKER